MKPHEALSFSAKWFTKGLISGGLICSQYHLVAKESPTKANTDLYDGGIILTNKTSTSDPL